MLHRPLPELDALAVQDYIFDARLVRLALVRIAVHRASLADGDHLGRDAASCHARRRRQHEMPELAVGLDLDLAMRILERRFLDLAGDFERIRGVISAPAVMRESRAWYEHAGHGEEQTTGNRCHGFLRQ